MSKSDGIDRSKRVAYGCKISSDNILSTKRTRKNMDYNTLAQDKKKKIKKIHLKIETKKMLSKSPTKWKKIGIKEVKQQNETVKKDENVKETVEKIEEEEKIIEEDIIAIEEKVEEKKYNTNKIKKKFGKEFEKFGGFIRK